MTDDQILAYVKASATLQGLALDAPRAQSVAAHLARTAQLASLLQRTPMAVDSEMAEIYCPLPFPPADPATDTP